MTVEEPAALAPADERQAGLLETAVGVVTEPVPTLKRVTARAEIGWAVVVTLVLGLLSIGSTIAQLRTTPVPADNPIGTFLEGPGGVIAAVLGGTIGSLFFLALGTGILHVMALILKGRGAYRGLFCGLAFAAVPNAFQVPLTLAGVALGAVAQAIAGAIGFGISVWIIILATIAVRENYGLTTGRAIATVLIPIGAFIVLIIGLAILLAIVVAVGVSQAGP